MYGVTAHQVHWGGPLWWPAAVAAATLAALAALGFAAGTLLPSRFTAPVTAIAAFFVVALSTQLIVGSQSYWNVSPIVSDPWDIGSYDGVATFYPYVPDLAIVQVMFLAGVTVAVLGLLAVAAGPGGGVLRRPAAAVAAAGLLAAGTGAGLAGTGTLGQHGMITIPALHDAASDRPLRYTPVCSDTAIPVCLNPAYASYLPAMAAALPPVLSQLAGLPGAPARISQAAAAYHQGAGNGVGDRAGWAAGHGTPPVYRLLLPDQLTGPGLTAQQWAALLRISDGSPHRGQRDRRRYPASRPRTRSRGAAGRGPGAGVERPPGRAGPAGAAAGAGPAGRDGAGAAGPAGASAVPPLRGSPGYAAAQRFAALPAPVRHAWLARHLAALRAGQLTLAQLP